MLSECIEILEEYIKNGCKGDLDLYRSNIESLPDNLEVGGNLNLGRCYKLTSIGDNLEVGGDINLSWCEKLISLPDNLEVGRDLNLYNCINLTSLPDGLNVGGNLVLIGCKNLTSLPDNLKVGRYLDLSWCEKLSSIPDNLKVGGNLDLGRTKVKTLPPTLEVKGDIIVDLSFNINPYRKEILFIKAFEGEQVPIIRGEVKVGQFERP